MRDALVLTATRGARGFGAGALSVVLALDLASAGYAPLLVGGLLGVAMGGASAWALAFPRWERSVGRRRLFVLGSGALAVGGVLLWVDLASPIALLAALLLGGIVAGATDISPLGASEQAALAEVSGPAERTARFGLYNFTGYVGAAVGALVAAPIAALPAAPGGLPASPRDAVLLLYALLGLALVPAYLALSHAVEPPPRGAGDGRLSPESRRRIVSLSTLFVADAFGGGLVANALVVYYLDLRFHPSTFELGAIIFLGSLAAGISILVAVPIARRIGLVPTMVFTHLPSNVLLALFAVSPTLLVAAVVWVARSTLSQMDVPTRQSYAQAIVRPEERTASAAYTTAARSGQAFGAPVTGAFLGAGGPWLAGPFALAAVVKIGYDLALYRRFRRVVPPEESEGADR